MRSQQFRDALRSWHRQRWDLFLLVLVLQAGASAIGWIGITRHAEHATDEAVAARVRSENSASVAFVLERVARGTGLRRALEDAEDRFGVVATVARPGSPVLTGWFDGDTGRSGELAAVADRGIHAGELRVPTHGEFGQDDQSRIAGGRYVAAIAAPDGFGGTLVVAQPIERLDAMADAAASALVVNSAAAAGVGLVLTWIACAILIDRHHRRVRRINESLVVEVETRVRAATRARDGLIFGLAKLADCRDSDTGLHLDRISTYSGLLARAVRRPEDFVTEAWIARLCVASTLHDIGKVGIADAILLKPGPLSPAERSVIERHPEIGAETLRAISSRLGPEPLIEVAHEIALAHHERWDGGGYPNGLRGEEIPLSARIVAVADVYDALTTPRVYKPAMPHDAAAELIRRGAGAQFDPEVVRAFDEMEDEIRRAAVSLAEPTHGGASLAA